MELPQVVLGGCSMGGSVAMAVPRAAPQQVARLLLVDTRAVADNDESVPTASRSRMRNARAPRAGSRRAPCRTCWEARRAKRRPEVVASVRVPVQAGTT
ncbi:alpha/beta fold hydrolase [Saccharopolyspora sp. ASAGF58]|uniref:alpha/beta fold hydrolase n=1 Tax=Saccharopolyspora sp. ASAGF58 TaxID=2719023 RepID=UPI00353005C7